MSSSDRNSGEMAKIAKALNHLDGRVTGIASNMIPAVTGSSDTSFPQLCKFYGVETDKELIERQAEHIERLQEKLKKQEVRPYIRPRIA